jgi:hypothetical protein
MAATSVGWLRAKSLAAAIASVLSSAVPTEPPICWLVLTSADAAPLSAGADSRRGRVDRRRDREPDADADEQQRREDVADVCGVQPELGEQRQSGARDRHADDNERPWTNAAEEKGAGRRRRDDVDGHQRQERQTRRDRAVAEQSL